MKIYTISTEYIDFLRNKVDKKVMVNEDDGNIRKYIGVMFTVNDFNYFVPLSSPKDNDYEEKDGKKEIRKSVVPIHRIIVKSGDEVSFFGKLKFSSMIPVPDTEVFLLDENSISDVRYKSIIQNQIRYIRKNKDILRKRHAEIIYKQKNEGLPNIGYLKNTVDFTILEKMCKEYEHNKKLTIESNEQVSADKEV